jgi:hypothetical protein
LNLSITFTSTPAIVMRSYRACHRTAYIVRWVMAVVAVLAGVATRAPFLVALGLGSFAFAELSVRRQLQPYLSGPREVTITMTDEEYRTQGPDRATARTWSTFTKVNRVGAFWVLRISNMAALAFPADALNEAQTKQFVAFVSEKGLYRT